MGRLLYEEPFAPGVEKSRADRVFKPADLILLVNSAAESIYSKEMIDMYRDMTPLRGAPHVIMISSDADTATGSSVSDRNEALQYSQAAFGKFPHLP